MLRSLVVSHRNPLTSPFTCNESLKPDPHPHTSPHREHGRGSQRAHVRTVIPAPALVNTWNANFKSEIGNYDSCGSKQTLSKEHAGKQFIHKCTIETQVTIKH